jgi:hypothetical protein
MFQFSSSYIFNLSLTAAYRAALRKLGDVRLQEGKPDEALTLLEPSLHRVPTDQALLYTQGYIAFCRLWLSLEKVGEALSWAEKARHYCIEYGFKHQHLTLDRLLAQPNHLTNSPLYTLPPPMGPAMMALSITVLSSLPACFSLPRS